MMMMMMMKTLTAVAAAVELVQAPICLRVKLLATFYADGILNHQWVVRSEVSKQGSSKRASEQTNEQAVACLMDRHKLSVTRKRERQREKDRETEILKS